MIITTRETAAIREAAFNIGITQASAASRTEPGGFGKEAEKGATQFSLSDKRTLDEVAVSVMRQGYTPSFCTACYRKNRTGETFMDLAKPGDIQHFCQPNSILTLMEYVEDHASEEGRQLGLKTIERDLLAIENGKLRRETEAKLLRIKEGARDLYF
jgi:2-iminoacetate synthase